VLIRLAVFACYSTLCQLMLRQRLLVPNEGCAVRVHVNGIPGMTDSWMRTLVYLWTQKDSASCVVLNLASRPALCSC